MKVQVCIELRVKVASGIKGSKEGRSKGEGIRPLNKECST